MRESVKSLCLIGLMIPSLMACAGQVSSPDNQIPVAAASAASTSVTNIDAREKSDSGIIQVKSQHSVNDTLDKLEGVLKSKGMKIFARIDHKKGAESVGKSLRDTQLLIFGNPKVGSPLMQCNQTVAMDLPQKALAWQDEAGQVWLSYNAPDYLAKRHALADTCAPVLKKVTQALANFVQAATH